MGHGWWMDHLKGTGSVAVKGLVISDFKESLLVNSDLNEWITFMYSTIEEEIINSETNRLYKKLKNKLNYKSGGSKNNNKKKKRM